MPSSFTTNGGIELPANGEQDGIWGDTVNDNMQIIDRLTNGVGAIALSGTTHTLTTLNGEVSDGQYAVLVFGGSPSGTNTVTISPNDAQHVYIVRNTTAQSIVLTQGSGGNVTVAAGKAAIVACDGAGSVAAVTDITAGFSFQGASAALTAISGLAVTDGNFIIGNGTTWVAESGNTVLTSIGVTATTTELNIMDGVTATTAEINILDGVTATTAELNFTDGVTSNIQTQLDGTVKTTGNQTVAGNKTFSGSSVFSGSLTASGGIVASSSVTSTADDDGEISAGTYTPTPIGGNFKRIEVDGSITLAAPTAAGDYTLVIQITISDEDANIATSGFNRVSGDAFTYTVNHDFFVFITKCNGFTSAIVQALQ